MIVGDITQHGTHIKMKDLAPDIVRQRMIVEGLLNVPFGPTSMVTYCNQVTKLLNMTSVTTPICNYDPEYGWCAYMHWKESGIHIYSWHNRKPPFFSIDIYTCKAFKEEDVVKFTKEFFNDNLIELSWEDMAVGPSDVGRINL